MYKGGDEFWTYWLFSKHIEAMDHKKTYIQKKLKSSEGLSPNNVFSLKNFGVHLSYVLLTCMRELFVWIAIFSSSQVADMILLLGWFGYSLHGLIHDRKASPVGMTGERNQLGFGQIVPIFLLLTTIFVIREALEGMSLLHELYQSRLTMENR